MPSQVDYRMARRAVLRNVRSGRLGKGEVCDAHPELIRAARNVGEECQVECPICSQTTLRLVSYVFGDALKAANGRCVVGSDELERLERDFDEFARYVVEVCTDCSWNHLARSELLGRLHSKGENGRGGAVLRSAAKGGAMTRRARAQLPSGSPTS